MVEQPRSKMFLRPTVEDKHALTVALRTLFLVGQLTFPHLDMILSGQKTQRILIAQLLMFHDEIDGRSALAARKAFTNILGRRDVERRRFIGMKGTQTDEVHPALAQRDKFRHNIHNVCRFQNPLPCYRINHPPSFFSETKVKKLLDSFYFLLIEIFSSRYC